MSDATPIPRAPEVGQLVTYCEGSNPPRAALVGNVHADGTTVDLVVLLDGDSRLEQTRAAWAMGSGVVRCRTSILHQSDDPKRVRHWVEGLGARPYVNAKGETVLVDVGAELRADLATLARVLEAVGLLK